MSEIILEGEWRIGWALDLHTESSVFLENGSFDTKRTEIGEALYELKYRNNYKKIDFLVQQLVKFLKTRKVLNYLEAIIPVPPSKDREIQPVYEIAKRAGKELNLKVDTDYIIKVKATTELKSIEDKELREKILKDCFNVRDMRYENKKVLLFDDLYRSGVTLNSITKVLYQKGRVQNVYVVTLTKTRVKK